MNQHTSNRVKELRALLLKNGITPGTYKGYRYTESIYVSKDQKLIAKAIRIALNNGFPDVQRSGERSIALPRKVISKKVVYKKGSRTHGVLVSERSLVSFIGGFTQETQYSVIKTIAKKLGPKKQKELALSLLNIK